MERSTSLRSSKRPLKLRIPAITEDGFSRDRNLPNASNKDDPNHDNELQYICISCFHTDSLPKKFFTSIIQPGWMTLRSWIKTLISTREFITEEVVWRIMAQLTKIVAYLHDVWKHEEDPLIRVIYRDWSPSSILINALFHVKLLSQNNIFTSNTKAIDQSSTGDGTCKISSFIAPEVLLHQPCTVKSDVYSLGTILFLLATLSKPRLIEHIDLENQVVHFTNTPVVLFPIYSEDICSFLSMTLCADPLQRASITELLAFPAMEHALATLTRSKPSDFSLTEGSESELEGLESQLKFVSSINTSKGTTVDIKELMGSITITHPNVRIRHKRALSSNRHLPRQPIKLMPLGESEPRFDSLGHTQLMQAVIANDAVVAGRFVHLAGYRNKAGLTALMIAASLGHSELTKLLAMSEAKMRTHVHVRINQWVFQEATALMFAAGFGQAECVKHLYTREARMIETYKNRTSLMAACYFGHYSCAKILSQYEAKMRDKGGKTALMYATESNSIKCVQCLANKEAGITMEKTDKIHSEWTALMFAIYEGNYECIKVLAPLEAHISGAAAIELIENGVCNTRNTIISEKKFEIIEMLKNNMKNGSTKDTFG